MNAKVKQHLVQAIGAELGIIGFMAPITGWVLRPQRVEGTLEAAVGYNDLANAVRAILGQRGSLIPSTDVEQPLDAICGIIGSGWGRRNPTFVTAIVRETGTSRSLLRLEATALEGIISQRSAKKAISRIVSDLTARFRLAGEQ
jgi:hypothetical protein